VTLDLDGVVVRRGRFALGPVSARFGAGVWRLAGPNGAGKTSLLRVVAGDLPPAEGRVRLDGRDVHRDDAIRRRLGFSPVEPELPDFLAVEEAWRMLAALRGGDAGPNVARAAALGLAGGTRLGACSAGMRRKAEILGALAGEPDVLLLDEPFASLDVAAVQTLSGWIDAWRRDRVVLITHHGELPVRADGELAIGG
jgi:ABC-2 type transport system ATP-binding protein